MAPGANDEQIWLRNTGSEVVSPRFGIEAEKARGLRVAT